MYITLLLTESDFISIHHQDVIVIFLATAGFGVAGILASIAAKNWSDDVLDRIRNVPIAFPFNIDVATSEVIDIRNGMAATAVSQAYNTIILLEVLCMATDFFHHRQCRSLLLGLVRFYSSLFCCYW